MKKLSALLALLLVLLAQSALAGSIRQTIWYSGSASYPQNDKLFFNPSPSDSGSYSNLRAELSQLDDSKHALYLSTFESYFLEQDRFTPEPSDTRKALFLEMAIHYQGANGSDVVLSLPSSEDSPPVHPIIPISAFIPQGTHFKNLQVFHAKMQPLDNTGSLTPAWDECPEPILHIGPPEFDGEDVVFDRALDSTLPVVSSPDITLSMNVYHFSPFVIVWDEISAPPAAPQTGDSASLAPWLALLSGACALLLLRRKAAQA